MSDLDPALIQLLDMEDGERERFLLTITPHRRRELATRWGLWAHDGQTIADNDWTVWLIQAGRGFGKTRAGAEWVCTRAAADGDLRIALVGGTRRDVENVMVRGESGLLAVGRFYDTVRWVAGRGVVEFGSGAEAHVFAAETPDALRGPAHHIAWCDELAKWRRADATWDNLMLGLRLGERPQVLVTTTPRAIPLMQRIRRMRGVRITTGRTQDNAHLSDEYVAQVEASYAGTRLGRQEMDGELIEEVAGALWSRALIERQRVAAAPPVARVVVGVDPPAGVGGDACGIVAVAEANQGGAMVASVLRAADAALPVTLVHASRGKAARAEPVAMLYEGARAYHAGRFPALEDELCGLVGGGGYEGPGRSPDRADALVWAMSEVMLGVRGQASVRAL